MTDGCSRLQAFYWIVVPALQPGRAATAITMFGANRSQRNGFASRITPFQAISDYRSRHEVLGAIRRLIPDNETT